MLRTLLGRLQRAQLAVHPRSPCRLYRAGAMPVDSAPQAAPAEPAWVVELASSPGITSPSAHEYWTSEGTQPHGDDTVIALLHERQATESVFLTTSRVFLDSAARKVHTVWPVGRRVCGHPGLVHGGVTALLLDESFGQAYWAWFFTERGPGFTANLTVDYKKPAPANSYLCTTVELESVDGRKVRFRATVSERPNGEGNLYATASCLFIVARKD